MDGRLERFSETARALAVVGQPILITCVGNGFVAPQDRCIRISCGTESDLDLLAAALPDALAEARG